MMKISITIDTFLPLFAMIQAGRALLISRVRYDYLLSNKAMLEEQGLLFLITDDKMRIVFISNFIVWLIAIANFILFIWSISRIDNNWAPYGTKLIEFTAVLFHFIMFLIPQLIYSLFSQSKFKLLNKVKEKLLLTLKK